MNYEKIHRQPKEQNKFFKDYPYTSYAEFARNPKAILS
jgi:hypothetical protein